MSQSSHSGDGSEEAAVRCSDNTLGSGVCLNQSPHAVMAPQSVKRRHVLFKDFPVGLEYNSLDLDDWTEWGGSKEHVDAVTPLKQLPICMQEKRHLRDKRCGQRSRVQHRKLWFREWRRSCRRALEVIQCLVSACQLWKRPLCEIEGRFGSGIHSFFTFLRDLFFLNLVAFTVTAAFVLVPTLVFSQPSGTVGDRASGPLTGHNPQCGNASAKEPWSKAGQHTYFVHIFTGEGFLETSYLFYGHYQLGATSGFRFSIRMSYLLSTLAYLLFCFFWITRRMVREMIKRRLHSRDYRTRLSTKVFTGWDYCIRCEEDGAIKQHSISNDLKMDLQEEVQYLEKLNMSLLRRALLILTRVLVNTVILLLMCGAFYCIFLATAISQEHEQMALNSFTSDQGWSRSVLTEYLPPIVISLVNFLLPLGFTAMVRLEGYSPNAEVNVTLMRSLLLKLASLGIFLFSLGQKVLCVGKRDDPSCSACGYNQEYQCWETTVGQEMYKIIVFNFLAEILITLLVRLPRRLLVDHTSLKLAHWFGKEEFVIPLHILDIVAEQTVIWIGAFYSPLLPLINSFFLFITFYLTKYTLCNLCKPSKKLFRASSSKFFFQFVLLLGLSLASIPLLYTIYNATPSHACGLFAKYPTAWYVVQEAVATSLSPAAQRIMNYAGSDAFAFPLIIIFCLVLTVYISQDRANRQTIAQLKVFLAMEARDKRFLVKELALAMNGFPEIRGSQ